MNRQAAKAMYITVADLWDYFGLGKQKGSLYNQHCDFCPNIGPMSITAPTQLHRTKRHKGVYVYLDGLGCPEHTSDAIAMLDGIKWGVMREAVEYVNYLDPEAYRTLLAVTARSILRTKKQVADEINISRQGMEKRMEKACLAVLEYLEQYLEKQVNRQTKLN